ncbi:DNA (cytosine-5-)-methyltransferase [Cereibacter johrii]|uniref:DNA (cytosine-5-)-methyltransferase n=1 Tax=Cereibacter johrii TaxID=445629 RepID=UPI000DCBF76B|nr:DNA (cytosine-5-)-methyltransferase [Cereibacter johrii]RAZ84463.1 DNA (cytosine-5-)-methyltransferase [Cereibacter johrii]
MEQFSALRQAAGLNMQQAAAIAGCAMSTAYRWENGEIEPRPEALEALRRAAKSTGGSIVPAFRFIDLFAGIGGLRRGFDAVGGHCVFTSEWDRFAQKTYRANYHDRPDHVFKGDITKVEMHEIPEHDVLLAGFPCQPFSIAGVSKKNSLGRQHGFRCDTQGTLFFDVARIIESHRPKVFLLENVKNLLSHDKGRTFAVIGRTLEEELGYRISTRVIDARCFVPQHRERIFIVGVRKDLDMKIDLSKLVLPSGVTGPRFGTVLHNEDGSELPNNRSFLDAEGRVSDRYTLSDKLWKYLQDYAEKHRQKGNGFGFGLTRRGDVARTLSARYHKDGSEILVDRGAGLNPRRLTPRECARLMGFDRPGGSEFLMPVSDTQAYRQFGNSVVVPVVEAVARHMQPVILSAVGQTRPAPPVAAE